MSEAATTTSEPTSVFAGGLTAEQNATKPEAPPAAKADPAATPEAEGEYEYPWLKETAGGKFKKAADLGKAYEDFGAVVRMKSTEAKTLKGQVDAWAPHHGAPKAEDGTPAPYEFKLPADADLDPTVREALTEIGHELDLAPAAFEKAMEKVLPWFLGAEVGRREATRDNLKALYGDTPEAIDAGVKNLEAWAGRLGLGGDEQAVEDFIECGNHPAAVRTIERLRRALSGSTIGPSAGNENFGGAEYAALVAKNATGTPLTQAEQAQLVAYLNASTPDTEG